MHARKQLVGAALVAAAVLLPARAAFADGGGDAWTDGQSVGANADDTSGGDGGGGGGGSNNCTYSPLTPEHAGIADDMAVSGIGPPRGTEPGAWYRKICYNPDGTSTGTIVWIPDRVDPAVLAAQAADRVPIPVPGLNMNPDTEDGSVVNVPTWLWIDGSQWNPVSAQASAGGVTVTATATPERVTWAMGNGDSVVCTGPGTPYDSARASDEQATDCSYTYRHSSAREQGGTFTVTATVTWYVSWTIVGAPGGGQLGTAPQSQSVLLRVAEIQALNQ